MKKITPAFCNFFYKIFNHYYFFLFLRIVAVFSTNIFYGYSRKVSPHLSQWGKMFWIHSSCLCFLISFVLISWSAKSVHKFFINFNRNTHDVIDDCGGVQKYEQYPYVLYKNDSFNPHAENQSLETAPAIRIETYTRYLSVTHFFIKELTTWVKSCSENMGFLTIRTLSCFATSFFIQKSLSLNAIHYVNIYKILKIIGLIIFGVLFFGEKFGLVDFFFLGIVTLIVWSLQTYNMVFTNIEPIYHFYCIMGVLSSILCEFAIKGLVHGDKKMKPFQVCITTLFLMSLVCGFLWLFNTGADTFYADIFLNTATIYALLGAGFFLSLHYFLLATSLTKIGLVTSGLLGFFNYISGVLISSFMLHEVPRLADIIIVLFVFSLALIFGYKRSLEKKNN